MNADDRRDAPQESKQNNTPPSQNSTRSIGTAILSILFGVTVLFGVIDFFSAFDWLWRKLFG